VEEAAEPIASPNVSVGVGRRGVAPAVGWLLVEAPVGPVGVVAADVFAEDVVEMSPAGDEDAVGSLAPRAGDAPLAERVSGLLHCPCGGGVGGDAGQMDAAIVVLDEEQHVEPVQKDGAGMEEVGRCDRLGLGGQKLLPAVGCAPRCWVDAGGLEDLPDGGGRDLVPEARQLAA
jgi:hypothetical protein